MSFIPSSSCNCASILACSAIMRGTYVDVEGALRVGEQRKKNRRICVRYGWTDTDRERIDGRHSEDLSISVMEVSEFPDGQLFDGRCFGLRRYPEARYGSNLSGSHWGGRVT